jgi:hypothetical protein
MKKSAKVQRKQSSEKYLGTKPSSELKCTASAFSGDRLPQKLFNF